MRIEGLLSLHLTPVSNRVQSVESRATHRVYLPALPAFFVGRTVVLYTTMDNSPYWLKIANAFLR